MAIVVMGASRAGGKRSPIYICTRRKISAVEMVSGVSSGGE